MPTGAKSGFGVKLNRNAVAVAEIISINGLSLKQSTKEVTNHDSTDRWAEFVAGIKSADDIKIKGNFLPGDTGQAGLLADFADGLAHVYQIAFPAGFGATWDFSAIITAFTPGDFSVDDALTFDCSMKVTGKPVLNLTYSTGLTTPYFSLSPAGTNVPAPSGTPGTYVNEALTGTSSVTVTPTASAGVITVNGVTVPSWTASGSITLGAAGSVTPITIVVQETGKVAKTYTILVARP